MQYWPIPLHHPLPFYKLLLTNSPLLSTSSKYVGWLSCLLKVVAFSLGLSILMSSWGFSYTGFLTRIKILNKVIATITSLTKLAFTMILNCDRRFTLYSILNSHSIMYSYNMIVYSQNNLMHNVNVSIIILYILSPNWSLDS